MNIDRYLRSSFINLIIVVFQIVNGRCQLSCTHHLLERRFKTNLTNSSYLLVWCENVYFSVVSVFTLKVTSVTCHGPIFLCYMYLNCKPNTCASSSGMWHCKHNTRPCNDFQVIAAFTCTQLKADRSYGRSLPLFMGWVCYFSSNKIRFKDVLVI